MKSFGGIKNIRRFAVHSNTESGTTRISMSGIFYALLIILITVSTPVWSVNAPTALRVECNGKAEPFFIFRQTNSTVMHSTEKNLQGVKHSNPSATTVVRNTAISSNTLQRQLSKLQKEVTGLHAAYEQARKEKFYYLFYISKMCSWYLPYYRQKNPIDSQDWEKLYNQSTNLNNIL